MNEIILPDPLLPNHLFIIPTLGPVAFPTMMAPVSIQIPASIATAEEAMKQHRMIGLLLSKNTSETALENLEKVKISDLASYGIAAKIVKKIKMPDDSIHLLVQAQKRFKVKKILSESPHKVIEPEYLDEIIEADAECDALSRMVVKQVKQLAEANPFFTDEMRLALINAPHASVVADLVAFTLSLNKISAQEFIETLSTKERLHKLLVHLKKEQELSDLQKKIGDDVNSKLNQMQREFFLKEQLKVIKKELGLEIEGKEKLSTDYREKIENLFKQGGFSETIKKTALEEVSKFETLSEQSSEYHVSRNYLDLLTTLPWVEKSPGQQNIKKSIKVLNQQHYGLEKVKERIIEFLAVKNRTQTQTKSKGSILCLVGPPGVGKTSIAQSIAQSMEREFYRFSVGGMRDEAEIKGHRRTYIGAMPGKFIQSMKRTGKKNPVILIDEIDKIGNSYLGDPASALLEVLDPEQNSQFVDHYLDLPFDCSQVLFITTANTLSTIPSALLDRMEVIEIAGYTLEEKKDIAEQYLIPKVLLENGLLKKQFKLSSSVLTTLIKHYTREPGVRSLEQCLAQCARKVVVELTLKNRDAPTLTESLLTQWLGPQKFDSERTIKVTQPGIVTGLAWTAMGGEILPIEVTNYAGTGQLKLTGQMGDVMTESASIAWSFVKKHLPDHYADFYKNNDIHLHIPAGAIPKDGPSAGITMATAFYSLLTRQPLRNTLAMTGELSLVGRVLPIGGLKEKLLAAQRAGITEVVVPLKNKKDVLLFSKKITQGLKVYYAENMEDVLKICFSEIKNKQKKIQKKMKTQKNIEFRKTTITRTNKNLMN